MLEGRSDLMAKFLILGVLHYDEYGDEYRDESSPSWPSDHVKLSNTRGQSDDDCCEKRPPIRTCGMVGDSIKTHGNANDARAAAKHIAGAGISRETPRAIVR